MSYKWRKPLLVMYHDNYKYGTGLYVPIVNSLDTRHREFPYIPMSSPIVSAPPRVSLVDYDLYAPISFGYGRSLLKKRQPAEQTGRSRISSRYYPFYYGMEGL